MLLLGIVAIGLGACSGGMDRTIEHEVELLVGEPGRRADIAEVRLVARGKAAILFLETALYDADPAGRRRVIRTLGKIGAPEVAPILAHVAANDPDEEVRGVAASVLARLVGPAKL